jgi:hypothetical protein
MNDRSLDAARTELEATRKRRAVLTEKLDALNIEVAHAKAEVAQMMSEAETGERRYQSLPARKEALSKMRAEAEYLTDALEILDQKLPGLEAEVLTLEAAERLAGYAVTREGFSGAATELADLTDELKTVIGRFLTERIEPVVARLRESRPSSAWQRLPDFDRSSRFYATETNVLSSLPVPGLKIDFALIGEAADLIRREAGEAATQSRFAPRVHAVDCAPAPVSVDEGPPQIRDPALREEFMQKQLSLGRAIRAASGRIVMLPPDQLALIDRRPAPRVQPYDTI